MSSLFSGCSSLNVFILGEAFHVPEAAEPLPSDSAWIYEETMETCSNSNIAGFIGSTGKAGKYYRQMKVTFYSDSTMSESTELTAYYGMKAENLPVYERDDASFLGWYTESEGGTLLQEGDLLTQTAYYGQWQNNRYTLVLKANGGCGEDTFAELEYNAFYQLSDKTFTRDGMKLSSWNTKADGSGTSYGATEEVFRLSREDGHVVNLYAQWKEAEDTVTISFDPQGGSQVTSKEIKRGSALGTMPGIVREYYSFVQWHIGAADGPAANEETLFEEDTTLYGEWRKDPVVTFNPNGGGASSIQQRRVAYGQAVGELPDYPANANRYSSLIGWFTEPTGGTEVTKNTIVTEDVTWYAHWGWAPKFNTNGGSGLYKTTLSVSAVDMNLDTTAQVTMILLCLLASAGAVGAGRRKRRRNK